MAVTIEAIDHVQITVPKAAEAAAKRFYGEVLGLEEIPKPAVLAGRGGAWFQKGTLQVHLSVEEGVLEGNHASRRHVCYMVADLEEAEREMRAAGVEIIPDNQPVEGWLRFYVRDPGGNRLEIAQRA